MAFQGSLEELHLPDVIQLVAASSKTGAFLLEKGEQVGRIWLVDGQMVHSSFEDLEGNEAVFALATWTKGHFQFLPGEESPKRTITFSNTNLLMEAARRLDEWKVLAKKIPSLDLIPAFHPPDPKKQGQIQLNTQEWSVLSQINGRASLREIAKAMDVGTFEVAKLLFGLVGMGLVQLHSPVEQSGSLKAPPSAQETASAPSAEETETDPEDQMKEKMLGVLRKVRDLALETIGESGRAAILRHYGDGRDGIQEEGRGMDALREAVRRILETSLMVRGKEVHEVLRQKIRELIAQAR